MKPPVPADGPPAKLSAGAFLIIVASAISGYAGFGGWAPLLLGLMLHLTVADSYIKHWDSFVRIAASPVLLRAWAMSVGTAVVATTVSWALGLFMGTVG